MQGGELHDHHNLQIFKTVLNFSEDWDNNILKFKNIQGGEGFEL